LHDIEFVLGQGDKTTTKKFKVDWFGGVYIPIYPPRRYAPGPCTPKIWVFSEFFAILSCDAHLEWIFAETTGDRPRRTKLNWCCRTSHEHYLRFLVLLLTHSALGGTERLFKKRQICFLQLQFWENRSLKSVGRKCMGWQCGLWWLQLWLWVG